MRSGMIYFFQYYRVLMIIFVLFRHMHTIFPDNMIFYVLDGGSEAVNFSFILSGFFQYKYLEKNNFKSYTICLKNIFIKKKMYFIHYYIYLFFSSIYHLFIHTYADVVLCFKYVFLNGIFISTLLPTFTNSILASGWYFVDLVLCMIMSFVIYKLIKKIKSIPILISLLCLHFVMNSVARGHSEYFWIMYFSIYSRIIDYTIGMLIYKIGKKYILSFNATIMEIIALCGVIIIHLMELLSNNSMIFSYMLLANAFLIYVFSYQEGKISRLFKKNKVVDTICKHSFTIYIYNFIFLLYTLLSPWSPSPYLNLIIALIMITIVDELVNYLVIKVSKPN